MTSRQRMACYVYLANLEWLIELYESRIRGFRAEMARVRTRLGLHG